ncbi:DUF3263 domain-containing protein [Williamsia sp. CHRR-6]|uniref:DUF3263 domain-containing protein n=1 Tax=Williamsia sp. CHRR-6 TaxID=2835871 RepID=UPI001BDB3B0D|nr:DUF3263 domain-containing protein [Williamsia sp. CHRR-6]MBT0567030.1 DUF3263 domain-containing protein [Williamsia sp. CHRR-6]
MDGATARSRKGSGPSGDPTDGSDAHSTDSHETIIHPSTDIDPNTVGSDGLTRREHDILAFERQWWKYAGAKEEAIKELFGLSATRYYQVLNALVDRPESLAADPMLVKRLRRLRASRQKARAARRLGFDIT